MLRHLAKQIIRNIPSEPYETFNQVRLSSSNLLKNITYIQAKHPKQDVIPVIKSNAYGHGIREVAQILNKARVPFVAVDGYFEAGAIRDITKHKVLVMGAIKPENVRLLDTKKCSFVVNDVACLAAFGKLGKPVRVHMELNTGMNRLGLDAHEIQQYLDILRAHPNLQLEGLMSHLADADNPKNSFTTSQIKQFNASVESIMSAGWQTRYVHLAQTAGSTKVTSRHTNAIRLGIGLYGINPLSYDDPKYPQLGKLQPVLELKSTIIKVHDLKKGDKVSYNGIYTARRPMRVGVLPLGYYEGYPRALSNKGIATYNSRELPVVGRVCMNHTMIDLAGSTADVGSEVTLIARTPSEPNSITKICKDYGIFPYELITGIAPTIRRIII